MVVVDFEVKSTTGFTADCDRSVEAGGAGGAGGRAAGAAAAVACETAGAETCVVDLLTVRVVFSAGFAAADLTCFTVLTVFVAEVLAGVLVSATTGVESVTDGAGVLDVLAGALSVGAGVGIEAAGGAESDGTGWACCASTGVAESARTAAIAGRALARAYLRVIFIMGNNRRV